MGCSEQGKKVEDCHADQSVPRIHGGRIRSTNFGTVLRGNGVALLSFMTSHCGSNQSLNHLLEKFCSRFGTPCVGHFGYALHESYPNTVWKSKKKLI